MRFFDEIESETLDDCLDLFLFDGFLLLRSVVPLIANISEEDIIMSEVYAAVIIESNELISSYLSIMSREKRNEVILSLL